MSLKISQYATSVSALASGDLMDVSKLISTSPDVYSSDKLNYSVLLSEIIADGSILTGSGTTNFISKFSSSGTLANSLLRDDGSNVSINNVIDASYKLYINSDKLVGLGVVNNAVSGGNNFGISGSATNANTGSNIGMFGNALLSSAGTNLGVRGMAASESVTVSTSIVAAGSNVGGFFQGNASSGIAYGLVATADATSNQASATFTGAYIRAYNAGTKYSLRLEDGSEGTGKFLKSITSIGQANWAALAISDITASLGTSLQVVRVNAGATALEYATLTPSNLGNANLTADAAIRTYTLAGTASTDYVDFLNGTPTSVLRIRGDKKVLFGTQITLDATGVNATAIQQNLALASDYAHIVYNNPGSGVYYLSKNGVIESYYPSGGSCIINFNSAINFWSKSVGDNFAYYSTNSDSLMTFQVRNESKIGTLSIGNALGATQTFLKGGNGSYHLNDLAIGATSISAQFGVKGTGSTSATTTALFQNSSSVSILTITDDKVATFGGRVISISAPIQLNTASSATPTPNADADGQFNLTALAANATFGAPTGTPTGGQKLMIRIKDNGTARTLAYNAIYRAIGITLPTTTVISKTLYIACIYNAADTKWDAIATAQEA
jgi:hypothetical protein